MDINLMPQLPWLAILKFVYYLAAGPWLFMPVPQSLITQDFSP